MDVFKRVGTYKGTAKELGIDRRTVKKWVFKAKQPWGTYNPKGLKRTSTRPRIIHKALNYSQEDQVIRQRIKTGSDCLKLKHELAKNFGIIASEATFYRVIKARRPDLIREVLNYRRPKFQNGKCMRPANTTSPGYIQADVKYVTPELSGLSYTSYEYALVDIYSRYKLALILPVLDEAGSILTLKYALENAPFKISYIQTDNGLEFQSLFHNFCNNSDIKHYYIHKNSPNENAVIERTFRTDQDEFFFKLDKAPQDINELNLWFQKFLGYYNQDRLHFSLNFQTPLEVLEAFKKGGYIKS